MKAELSDTVQRILQEAAELFIAKGYDATSMRDIAQRAGVSKSLLYHHFTDKYQIFMQVTATSGLGLNETVSAAVAAGQTPTEKLRIFMTSTADFFEKNRLSWIAASQDFWNSNEKRMSLQSKLRRDGFEKLLRSILEEGVAKGEFEINDLRLSGRLILSSLNWMHRWYNPSGSRRAGEIAEEYFRMITGGIAKTKDS